MKHGLGGTLAGFCTCDEFVFLNSLASVLSAHGLWAADLSDLQSVANWENVPSGVWRAELGSMEGEIRYSDLAAASPR